MKTYLKKNEIKKILVVMHSNLGDVILTLPVISALKNKYDFCLVDVVAREKVFDFVKEIPFVANAYLYKRKSSLYSKMILLLELKRKKYDFVLDFRNSMIPYLIGVPSGSLLLNAKINKIESRYKRYAYLLELLDLKENAMPRLNLYSKENRENFIKKIHSKGIFDLSNILLVGPGARYKFKRWPATYFVCLIKKILAKTNMQVVLVGDCFDKETCREISIGLIDVDVVDLSDVVNMNELSFLVERARLVLSNDSALMHLANYCKRPVLGIFGPTNPSQYGLVSETAQIVAPPNIFFVNAKSTDEDKMRSLSLVTPEKAFEVVLKLIKL